MSNPIQGINTTGPTGVGGAGQSGATQGSGQSKQPETAPQLDLADVGGTQALLTQIADAASGVPTIDQGKVDALRQQIAAGTYQVNPQQIAQKMLGLDANLAAGGSGK
ncbi:MAG: flagellar biosynthesis anti-sigma factor FlgM [Stellaceae bacterium]